MKYYSDVTKKVYETQEELEVAEKKIADEKEKKEIEAANRSKEKKELATAVEDAEKELSKAYDDLDVAKEKAVELQKEYLKKLEDILNPAQEKVKEAQLKKYDAVKAFNDKFGAFTTTYTGERAANEMSRALRYFNNVFDHFFF